MLNKPLCYKLTFWAIEKISQIAVFNLQASDYVHCENEEGTNPTHQYIVIFFLITKFAFFMIFFNLKKILKLYWAL